MALSICTSCDWCGLLEALCMLHCFCVVGCCAPFDFPCFVFLLCTCCFASGARSGGPGLRFSHMFAPCAWLHSFGAGRTSWCIMLACCLLAVSYFLPMGHRPRRLSVLAGTSSRLRALAAETQCCLNLNGFAGHPSGRMPEPAPTEETEARLR